MDKKQPEALRLAEIARYCFRSEGMSDPPEQLESPTGDMVDYFDHVDIEKALLARINELEEQLAQRFDAADMATAAAQGFRDGVASLSAQADSVQEDAALLDWLEQHDGRYYNLDKVAAIVGTGFLVRSEGNMPQVHSTLREAVYAARKQSPTKPYVLRKGSPPPSAPLMERAMGESRYTPMAQSISGPVPAKLPPMPCGGTPLFDSDSGCAYRCDKCFAVIGSMGQPERCKEMNKDTQ